MTYRAFLIITIWLAASLWLWGWWINGIQSANLWLYIPLTMALLYEYTIIPGAFLFFLLKAKKPRNRTPQKKLKVAMITLCVPSSESLDIVEKQLKALSKVKYPHDSWVLDEGNSKEIKVMARKYGVKHFSRKGKKTYNQPDYPFKKATKAGNVNAWLRHVKKYNYDYFVQLDIDHIPKPDYLDKTLGHFRNKQVGWVQAPSVYGNLNFWTARGSAEQEMGLHGPIQMGLYGNAEAPLIIGSHTTFRMSAVQEIGGFQPTRAEDHLNTLCLLDKGYKGVFVPQVIAEGDGPETLSAYLTQQSAWAFSIFQVLKSYSPQRLKNLSWRRRFQFLFLETWYPLWSLTYLILFLVPVLGLLTNNFVFETQTGDFLYRFVPVIFSLILIFTSARTLYQPHNLRLSWRGIILHAVRWPVILTAVIGAAAGKTRPYQITPKGKNLKDMPTVRQYRPFLFFAIIGACSILFAANHYGNPQDGLYVFAGANLAMMLSVCLLDLDLRLRQANAKATQIRKYWLKPIGAVTAVFILTAMSVITMAQGVQQDIFASVKASSSAISQTRDISFIPPELLTDQELVQELKSDQYDVSNNKSVPDIGLHNPKLNPNQAEPYIQHTFIDWRDNRFLAEELLHSYRAGNTPLITVEPKGDENGARLLKDIAAGRHDDKLSRLATAVGAGSNDVYIRFAHEMDFGHTYAWGAQEPQKFIAAYKHVVNYFKDKGVDNARWMWSPGGVPDAALYYPGDNYVDVIGTTILYDRFWMGERFISFHDMSYERTWLALYNKPLWIAEFGVGRANPLIQKQMVADALASYKDYGFDKLVYIDIPDSNLDGPDYRLHKRAWLDSGFARKPLTARREQTSRRGSNTFHRANKTQPAQTQSLIRSPEDLIR